MFCPTCGNDNPEGTRFCQRCGQPVPAQSAPGPIAVPPPPVQGVNIQCVAGPDTGRAFQIGGTQSVLGKCAGLADPMVSDQHVWVFSNQGGLQFQSADPQCFVEVGGYRLNEGYVPPGQQFQLGGSLWQVVPNAPPAYAMPGENPIDALKRKLNQLAGTEKLEGFSLKDMFSEVFKKRTNAEIEEYFIVGTPRTTPRITDVPTGWPKPWLFFRVLAFVILVYAGLDFVAEYFQNPKAIPGLLFMGALGPPLATVILFWELNAPRNVSFSKVLMLVCMGGVVSLIIALFGFTNLRIFPDWMGASDAGFIEEPAKLLTVMLLLWKSRDKYILNGLLYGAAVGAGFGFFETAGYAFERLFAGQGMSIATATENLRLRGLLAPFMHVSWTAITTVALWKVKGDQPMNLQMLINPKFLRVFAIPVVLHMVWNAPFQLPLWTQQALVGLVAWFIVFGFVQQGLKQVRDEQISATRTQIMRTQAGAA